MGRKKLYGLIGFPLTHSFSPGYFNAKFEAYGIDAKYELFPIKEIASVREVIASNAGLAGLNVTIPYKEAVMPFLDGIDAVAAQVGAVNCISIMDGKTRAYNTDVIGFEKSLLPLLQLQHTHALVLGSGGASKAVLYVLAKLGVTAKVVSRQPAPGNLAYTDVTPELIAKYTVIINTTPLGMYPNVGVCPPIPYEALGSRHLLYDLIYNPPITKFLAMGMAQGAQIKNGQEMLELQAEASWEIWNR